ncbi:MAG: PIN domain-containing protein [Acetobacteraceae bacterium]|nr:PIN domain-containing protein [Acetobacteraceae bacterium]
MDPGALPIDAVLLLDTTVYIDGLKRAGLPGAIVALLANRAIRHSALCVGELSFGLGRLDPAHPGTARNTSAITAVLDRLSPAEFVDLSPSGWARAGALAGALTRIQGFAQDRRRALFLDAALFVTAQEHGLTLVSGNWSDMDLLLRVGGPANVLLYGM